MTNDSKAPVTILGLGLMGQALAAAFLDNGHPTTVWNRTPAKAEHLVARGARLATTIDDAVKAGLAIICLTDYHAVHDLLAPADLDGAVLVNLTSGTSTEARDTARWAAQRGARYVDGAIMATPPYIGTPDALILLSGAPVDDQLTALGTVNHLGPDHGLASLYDAGGLTMMWGILNAWLHGTALLRTAGVNAATYAPFAQHLARGVAEWLPGYASQIDNNAYPAEASALETDARAMDHLIAESEAVGINTALPRLFKTFAARAISAGHGGEQYPVLIEEFIKPGNE
ncbi:NAD(P)-dependent oxidoreductase [Actinokineospora fastidiosa]|uniref:3-hydroxyisobutyrate dehydrogenase n=1 Tax=Actinokineospora fastidiosa TaxID=1816 RepID=A0A918L6H5_9PSEU|nr:NAD(P)-binding domain-containing protein [Actinokineospora fastidiosa]GGS15121.1 3-hydroxyisobutyrate dehydrogenase [Actinokineospora fastidiosa]